MAETIAEAALSFAVKKLGEFAIQKASFLRGVKEEVLWLKDELEMMQCFLRDAARKPANDDRIRKWISDVRQVAFDTEDAINTFALKVDAPRSRGQLGRCIGFPDHVYHLDKLGQEIESIKKRLKGIAERRETYGIQSLDDATMVSSDIDVVRRSHICPWHRDSYEVGLEGHVKTLLEKALLVEKAGLSVASIVGMGGVGKSTLAKKVYNNEAVGERFECRAWVSVSQEFNPKELLKELVRQLRPRESALTSMENLSFETSINKLPKESLERMVRECLQGKQYLIVVDDVWSREHWKYIVNCLTVEDKTSTLLITSRISSIMDSSEGYVHKLEGLNSIESWQLFAMASKCPQELENIGKMMVGKCHGLPLAINVMACLLLEKGESAASAWEVMKSHLEGQQDSVSAILELSYWDLPPQLKSCFLCLCFFKEDAIIPARKLIQLWIAEGIVPQGKERLTMEEIARCYLDELINRNMVQAIKLTKDGQVKYCQIHDLLWELSSTKAKEEINFHIINNENASNQSLDKSRHLSIYYDNESFMSSRSPFQYLRSLFFHVSARGEHGIPESFWERLEGSVRVLELGSSGLTMIPDRINMLVGLKYFGLGNNKIEKLPRSLGHLNQLQTLDASGIENLYVPNVLWKLDSLRHIYLAGDIMCKEPLKLSTLKNLQTLIEVSTRKIVVAHLAKMVSLRELDLYISWICAHCDKRRNADCDKILTLLAELENLVSLHLSWGLLHALSLNHIVNLRHLTVLKLWGKLAGLPKSFPPNLSFLTLTLTQLNEDPMPILGRLPNLSCLKLIDGSYLGDYMVIVCNGFPSLKVLCLEYLPNLTQIFIEHGGLPQLEELKILNSNQPNILPEEEEKRMKSNLQKFEISANNTFALLVKGGLERIFSKMDIPKVSSLLKFEAQLRELKDELHATLSFLEGADDKSVNGWIFSIIDVMLITSSVIASFAYTVNSRWTSRTLLGGCVSFPGKVYDVCMLRQNLKSFREKVKGIKENAVRHIRSTDEAGTVSSPGGGGDDNDSVGGRGEAEAPYGIGSLIQK